MKLTNDLLGRILDTFQPAAIAVAIWDDFHALEAQGRAKVFASEAEALEWIERQDGRQAEALAFADEADADAFVFAFRDYCHAAWTPNQGSRFQEQLDTATPAARLEQLRTVGVPV